MSNTEKLIEVRKQMQQLREEQTKVFKGAFEEVCSDLFRDNPALNGFTFEAYTPGFCDGDPCHYSSNHDWADPETELEYNTPEYKVLSNNLRQAMKVFTDDDIETGFGEDIRVSVTRNEENESGISVEVEEYWDHD